MKAAYTGDMKTLGIIALIILAITPPTQDRANPCENASSNVEERECYSKENARVTAQVDLLAANIAAGFRKDARGYGGVIGESLRKAASGVTDSQKTWKRYREQYCTAILESFTTGTGAETEYNRCQFELAQDRLNALTKWFPPAKRNAKQQ